MPRWSRSEQLEIAEVRENLKEALAASPPYPEVVGDRKILRFLRGHGHNVTVATKMYGNFLSWRKEFKVDAMRDNIINGMDHPMKFPQGKIILGLIPSLIITHDAFDKSGAPVCVDQYKFKPAEVLSNISLPDYLIFTTYCLEYRSMVVEQLSEQRERAYLAGLSPEEREAALDPLGNTPPHGVILGTLVIRDIGGVGLDHCSDKGREIIKSVVKVGSDNYPELLRKCYLVNCPWVFNALWFFIKGLLPHTTLQKISINGYNFRASLERDLDPELVPALIGGPYNGHMEPGNPQAFEWDRAFMLEGRSIDTEAARSGARHSEGTSPLYSSGSGSTDSGGSSPRSANSSSGRGSGSGRKEAETRSLPAAGEGASSMSATWLHSRLRDTFVEYPLWTSGLTLYLLHFCATEQWRTLLPFALPVLATWAVLLWL